MSSNYENKLKITTVCAAFLASMLVAAISYAGPSTSKLTLSVYEETPGSLAVLKGKYEDAIKMLKNRRVSYQNEYASTNLCVALIMTRNAEAAKTACDEAIAAAKAGMPNNVFHATESDKSLLALAYSNRAVLSWLRNEPGSAAEDVTRAHALAPDASFVTANWMVYNSKEGVGESPAIALNRP
jgi:tetratricopeptide (TPR) repeat protein